MYLHDLCWFFVTCMWFFVRLFWFLFKGLMTKKCKNGPLLQLDYVMDILFD